MLKYRADIDGLRAVAVLSVVVYHAHASALPGGFVGVDVFFVISGYLITKLIAADIADNSFSIAHFYVRRAKRILPALFTVLVSTWILGLWLLVPSERAALGRSIASAAAFTSNVGFWQDTGYFDIMAERKPLLHTWSLAVEEQFYLLWPVALFLANRFRFNRGYEVATFIAASFALSVYLVERHPPTAFYLLPSRAWELLIGAVLALKLVPFPSSEIMRNVGALAGLTLIATSLFVLGPATPFPGWSALLPCVGAGLVIASGERGDNVASKYLLSLRPVVFIGLISYSLYLWHWPLLTLARLTQRGTLTTVQVIAVVLVSAILAITTWHFVERPLRAKTTSRSAPILWRYATASAVVFVIGWATNYSGGIPSIASPEVLRTEVARFDINPLSGSCLRWQSETGPLPGDRCTSGGDRFARKVVIWGDSHADSASPAVVKWAADRGLATYQLTMAGCPPLLDVYVEGPGANYGPCAQFREQVRDYVTSEDEVTTVVLSARWTVYTENARFGRDDPGPITYLLDQPHGAWTPAASKRAFSRALSATLDTLSRARKSVVVLGTIPPLGVSIPDCLSRNSMPLSGVVDCSPAADEILRHLRFADEEIQRLTANAPGVCGFIPSRAFCSTGRCRATHGGDILYANDDHLSLSGALYMAGFFDFERCAVMPASAQQRTPNRGRLFPLTAD